MKSTNRFKARYEKEPSLIIQAPGRVNLIGEHTDYNEGFVLPAAIDKYLYIAFNKRSDQEINIFAYDLNEAYQGRVSDKIGDVGWVNFFIGIVRVLRREGHQISGFDCCFYSEIPIGAGLSSSSALECGILVGLNLMYDLNLSKMEMILISQKSNHQELGIFGGIMDQYACFNGQLNSAFLLDCKSNTSKKIRFEIKGYEILLLNTQVSHENATGGYNNGPEACRQALKLIQKKHNKASSLRAVSLDMLSDKILPKALLEKVKYVINENLRVGLFVVALENNAVEDAGKLMFASHEGLKTQYKVSCEELDFLVDQANKFEGVAGGRMMGGGFGGCTINLVKTDIKDDFLKSIKSKYKNLFDIDLIEYEVKLVDGLKVLKV